MIFSDTPATTEYSGIPLVAIAPSATILHLPILTPFKYHGVIQTLSSI